MKTTLRLVTTTAALLFIAAVTRQASAQTVWIGVNNVSASTNWSDTANWSTAASPAGTDVLFGDLGAAATAGTINSVVDNSSLNPNSLTFTNLSSGGKFHTVLIPGSVTLANAADLLVGGTSAPTVTTTNNFVGGGTLVQNGANMNVKWIGGTAGGSIAVLDMSGLTNFVYNNSGGTVTIASSASGSEARGGGIVNLAAVSNSITAGTIAMAVGTGNGGTTANALNLGAGTNVINANTINIAAGKVNTAVMKFLGSTGGLRLRGSGGTDADRANFVLGRRGNTGTGTILGSVLLGGHPVDVLAGSVVLGQYTSSQAGPQATGGVLQFDSGIVDVSSIYMGICVNSAPATATANGTLIVGGGLLNVGSIWLVNQAIGTAGGTLNITNGGVLNCSGSIVKTNSGGTGTIAINTGSLNVTGAIGSVSAPINSLNLTNATLLLAAGLSANANVTTLTCGGPTNKINVSSIPGVAGYPASLPLIKYSGALGGAFNIGLGTLPVTTPASAGFITNNTANSSIDLVLTAGPVPLRSLTWNGNIDGNWDIAGTANWKTNGVGGTIYNSGDFVTLDDSASGTTEVNLTTALSPGSVTVSNITKTYGLTGTGNLTGAGTLTKQGAGTLYITNSGNNDFSGTITIAAGTVRVGDGASSGTLGSGAIVNSGALVFNRDAITAANVISGAGTVSQVSSGSLTLGGASTYTGNTFVNSGTLVVGNATALGATNGGTTVASGATLDFNARNIGLEPVTVSGSGVGGNGALVNNGADIFPTVAYVTMTGDTVFGGSGRWDLRSATTGNPTQSSLLTGGQPYKLTKVGANPIGIAGATVDAALGDVEVQGGILNLEAAMTSLGNSQSNLTVWPGAQLKFFAMTNHLNKQIFLGSDGATASIRNDSGSDFVAGPIVMTNDCLFTLDSGTTLTLEGTLSGGLLTGSGGGTLALAASANASHAGTVLSAGTLTLNGMHSGGITNNSAFTTLAGTGTNTGFSDISGYLLPGGTNAAGTLTLAGLVLEGGAAPAFELGNATTIGSGVNDLVLVTGDLVVNGNTIIINPTGLLQTGVPYRLFNYTGTLIENAPMTAQSVLGYTFTVDTTTPGQVNLTASGGPPIWNGGSSTDSLWSSPANWNGVTIQPGDTLYFAGSTRLNNSNDSAADTAYGDLVFNTGAGAFTLNGNPIALGGNVVNNSTSTQKVQLGLDFGGNRTLNGVTGTLIIGGGLTNTATATTLTLGGTGILTNLIGALTGVETNLLLLNSNSAAWTLMDNASSTAISAPWAFAINNGTFTFGSASSAPVFTSQTIQGVPQDNQIGAVAGLIGTLNISNGTFTTTARVNTGAGGNGIGVVNQYGGTFTIASQFQGANGANSSASTVTVAGGTMNVGGTAGSGTLFVASRGTGVVNVAGSALINCSVLDVSRDAAGNTGGSIGTVNLDGGTLACTRVGTATANSQAGPPTTGILPTATLNFNGGTLKAKASSTTFLQGSTVAPIIPVTAIVKSGGAVVDTAGFNITFVEPLQHDSTLGVTPDGGLNKTGAGTLTLAAANTYTGNSTVNNGTLLVSGSLTASPVIVNSGGTLMGNGNCGSTITVNAGGTVAPGASVGVLTATNNISLGGTTFMEISVTANTNDLLRSISGSITYGGTLSVTNLGGLLTNGMSFKLFNGSSYLSSFGTLQLPGLGAGQSWNTSQLGTSGTISVVGSPGAPAITSATPSGGNLIISGGNGVTNGTYQVVTSTVVNTPLSSWTVLGSGQFDGNGNFSVQVTIDAATPQRFFAIRMP